MCFLNNIVKQGISAAVDICNSITRLLKKPTVFVQNKWGILNSRWNFQQIEPHRTISFRYWFFVEFNTKGFKFCSFSNVWRYVFNFLNLTLWCHHCNMNCILFPWSTVNDCCARRFYFKKPHKRKNIHLRLVIILWRRNPKKHLQNVTRRPKEYQFYSTLGTIQLSLPHI